MRADCQVPRTPDIRDTQIEDLRCCAGPGRRQGPAPSGDPRGRTQAPVLRCSAMRKRMRPPRSTAQPPQAGDPGPPVSGPAAHDKTSADTLIGGLADKQSGSGSALLTGLHCSSAGAQQEPPPRHRRNSCPLSCLQDLRVPPPSPSSQSSGKFSGLSVSTGNYLLLVANRLSLLVPLALEICTLCDSPPPPRLTDPPCSLYSAGLAAQQSAVSRAQRIADSVVQGLQLIL
jgi:hypothetical protein